MVGWRVRPLRGRSAARGRERARASQHVPSLRWPPGGAPAQRDVTTPGPLKRQFAIRDHCVLSHRAAVQPQSKGGGRPPPPPAKPLLGPPPPPPAPAPPPRALPP